MPDRKSNLDNLRIFFFVVGLTVTTVSRAYSQDTIPELTLSDIPGGTISRSEYFDGNSLWGYIDGGADIYMEYGFLKMLVQEIQWQGYHFTVNHYSMKDAEAAFGILSISRHRCLPGDSSAPWSCVTPYQLQVAHGTHYVSILNDRGTPEEQNIAKQITRKILDTLHAKDFNPPRVFTVPVFAPFVSELKFMRGILGIQNGYPDWQYLFEDVSSFSLYLLPIEIEGGFLRTALVVFSGEGDKQNFYKKLKVGPPQGKSPVTVTAVGLTRSVRELTPTTILYTETNLGPERIKPYLEEIESVAQTYPH